MTESDKYGEDVAYWFLQYSNWDNEYLILEMLHEVLRASLDRRPNTRALMDVVWVRIHAHRVEKGKEQVSD